MSMNLTPKGMIIKGFKATDENMCCRGFQYELNKWFEHEGDIELCIKGFHFCEYLPGPWLYYNIENARIFRIEAEEVLKSNDTGTARKHVCKRIRLVEEINIFGIGNAGDYNAGDCNTGAHNTGNHNIGYCNTGNYNTGNYNAGNWNIGDCNTGDCNVGDYNTGDYNAGDYNTGNYNTGNYNAGDYNAGDYNTGKLNTGNYNTGNGNVGDYHSGYLNFGEAPFYLFNKLANRKAVNLNLVNSLIKLLHKNEDIDPTPFLSLPNATPEIIKQLHEEHKKAREKK